MFLFMHHFSSSAIGYLKALGHTVVTTASERNKEWVEKMGADQVINYKVEKWFEVLEADSVDGVFQVSIHCEYSF